MANADLDETAIEVTAFEARCLGLIDDVLQGKTTRVVLLKHDKPVAAIVPLDTEPAALWGAMRGSVQITEGTDLTKATGETWKADA